MTDMIEPHEGAWNRTRAARVAATVDASAPRPPGEGHRTGTGGPDASGASEARPCGTEWRCLPGDPACKCLPWGPLAEHPERHCGRCGGPNIPWAAPSPLWNQVMRGGGINGDELYDGIVCPTCFAILAEERGVAELWRFSAERVHVPLQTVTPSGRVWDDRTWLWREPDGAEGPDAAIEAALHAALYEAYIEITYVPDWETYEGNCRVCDNYCADGDKADITADASEHIAVVHVRSAKDAEPILRQAVAEEIARRIEERNAQESAVGQDYDCPGGHECPFGNDLSEAAAIAREIGARDA